MGHLYQRGPIWWIQFYQDGQRQRMTTESTDEGVARRMLKEHEARVTLKEPVVASAAPRDLRPAHRSGGALSPRAARPGAWK